VEIRCYNPPRLDAPFGWLSRDHRKTLVVDGEVGFVTGLCVGDMWTGDPDKNIAPWRDTGIEVRGPAVAEITNAFGQVWSSLGTPLGEPSKNMNGRGEKMASSPPPPPRLRWAGLPAPPAPIESGRASERETLPPVSAQVAVHSPEARKENVEALPDCLGAGENADPAGNVAMRIVATLPATAGLMRLDQLVAALATERVWLTDAYYAGTTSYAQALMAAARAGVDVRLLVPSASDIPVLKALSRAGYRPLLEAGVRIFEWNGTMLHAKTAVADSRWARVGSTNLNLASWLGNCEMDAVIEDEPFAEQMEDMYLEDLENATEIVLDAKRKLRAPARPRVQRPAATSGGGSAGRAAAGTIRISNAIGAAFTGRRTLEPVEARLTLMAGGLLLALAALFAVVPRLLTYPIVVVLAWVALTLLVRGYKLYRLRRAPSSLMGEKAGSPATSLTLSKADLRIGERATATVPVVTEGASVPPDN